MERERVDIKCQVCGFEGFYYDSLEYEEDNEDLMDDNENENCPRCGTEIIELQEGEYLEELGLEDEDSDEPKSNHQEPNLIDFKL